MKSVSPYLINQTSDALDDASKIGPAPMPIGGGYKRLRKSRQKFLS